MLNEMIQSIICIFSQSAIQPTISCIFSSIPCIAVWGDGGGKSGVGG